MNFFSLFHSVSSCNVWSTVKTARKAPAKLWTVLDEMGHFVAVHNGALQGAHHYATQEPNALRA